MSQLAEILFAYPSESSFIRSDIQILSSHFTVEGLACGEGSSLPPVLLRGSRAKLIFSWFALGYATAAAILTRIGGPRTILVAGGYDVAIVPEISYGIMLSPGRRWKVVAALSLSDRVLAVSNSIAGYVNRWAPRSRVTVCPLGFDSVKFHPSGRKSQKVLTVGIVNRENLQRKGLQTFLSLAWSMPDLEFVLVGGGDADLLGRLRRESPGNLRITGYIPDDLLIEEMQSARVYIQPSAYEAFGCALAEAMLCECVPVVTTRGALPEVVGESGFYAPFADARATERAVRRALSEGDGRKARDRVRTRFPIEARELTLTRIVQELIEGHSIEE